jgi:uncharacterized protein YutE (UPF0331/DUF86 family)/predicted nucleotidyltransferase
MEDIDRLKEFFSRKDAISFALLFGSRSLGRERYASDYDIAIYLAPDDRRTIEYEELRGYPERGTIEKDLEPLLRKELDLIVLNNSPCSLAADIVTKGIPIVVKDEELFVRYLWAVTSAAMDYRELVREYYDLFHRATSLSEPEKARLLKIVIFLENELTDYEIFKDLTWIEYERDRSKRRNVERWVETLVNSAIDVAKILVSSERLPAPETYRDLILKLKLVGTMEDEDIEKLAGWVKLRNILAQEYLDMRWENIKNFLRDFLRESPDAFHRLIQNPRAMLER